MTVEPLRQNLHSWTKGRTAHIGRSDERGDTFETHRLHPSLREGVQHCDRIGHRSETVGTGSKIAGQYMKCDSCRHSSGCDGRTFDCTEDRYPTFDADPPAKFDADCTDAAFGMRATQHR